MAKKSEKQLDLSKCDDYGLPKNWKEIADGIFKEGGDIKNVIVALGITKKQHELLLFEDQYKDVIDNGMIHSEAFWLEWGKNNVGSKTANTALFNAMMNRMFAWDKKIEKDKDKKGKDEKQKKVNAYLDRYKQNQTKESFQ